MPRQEWKTGRECVKAAAPRLEAQRVEEVPAVEPVPSEAFASEAISGYWDDHISFAQADFPGKVIARLPVPAGSYVIFAKAEIRVHVDQLGTTGCRLIAGADGE